MSRHDPDVHKNDFGHVLIMAGSPSMLGAACLTALGAMRAGAGLVTAAVPRGLNLTLQEKIAHVVMTRPVVQTRGMSFSAAAADELLGDALRYHSAAIGPGISLQPSTVKFALRIVEHWPRPLVVDADALNAVATRPGVMRAARGLRVLTPHPGEMARLTGLRTVGEKDRSRIAAAFAARHGVVLVLKGHRTVIASPEGKVAVNSNGNAGMATAGSGDVLTGMIAAFLAQGIPPFEAARAAVHCHGAAGDRAARARGKASLIATDLLNEVRVQ